MVPSYPARNHGRGNILSYDIVLKGDHFDKRMTRFFASHPER